MSNLLDKVNFARIKELNEGLEKLLSENEDKYPYAREFNKKIQESLRNAKTLEEKQIVFSNLWKQLKEQLLKAHSELEEESKKYIKLAGELEQEQNKLQSLRAKLSDQDSTKKNN